VSASSRLGQVVVFLLLGAGLGAVALLMAQAGTEPREMLLRYAMAALVVVSIAPTHVLLPDPAVPWLLRLNRAPGALLRRALGRWIGVGVAVLAPAVALAIYVDAPIAGLEAGLLLAGASLYAFQDTMALGPVSQAWQEGTRGGLYREILKRNPRASFQVPHGMVPAMLASVRVFAVFLTALFASIIFGGIGPLAALVPGALLLAWSTVRTLRLAPRFDRALYQSSALYTELLYSPVLQMGAQEDLDYDSVYWVPGRWRPHVWAGLLQLDRRVPMGRIFALGVLAYWILLATGVSPTGVAAFLVAALVARNAAVVRHASADTSPPNFNLAFEGLMGWVMVRFWMNTRWTLPVVLAIAGPAFVSARVSWAEVALWAGVDLVLALLTALAATYVAEYRYRSRFA